MTESSPLKTGRILVVEDDRIQMELIQRLVRSEGYSVRGVDSGEAAIEMIAQWFPSIVLLDIHLPGLNGLEILRQIRQVDRMLYLPILLVTAESSIAEKRKGFEAGADDFIVKPYNREELLLRINAHLRRYRQSSEADRHLPEEVVRIPLVIGRPKSGLFKKGFRFSKRLFDLTACLFTLPLTLPVLFAIAIAIRLDAGGPALFTQERTGKNGRRFKMFKFRTMVENAEELKTTYAHLNELTWPDFKIENDPRITRVGRFLRKSSLDELPQLFNIILGDMSLVGPRPTSFTADTYKLWQTERLEVRPGLTGLWQVSGRSHVDFVERVELDIEYIERQSWHLDLKILWQTLTAVVQAKGAS